MRAKVVLVARMNDPQANFPFTRVEIKSGRIIFPIAWATKDRKQVKQYTQTEVMCYYARYHNNGINSRRAVGDRVVESLGKDPVSAYTRYLQLDQDFERVQRGLAPINLRSDKENKTHRPERNIISCAAKFHNDLIAESKKPRAIESYMGRVRNLLRFFEGREKQIDDITEDDIRDFLRWAQNPKHIHQRKGGHPNNTQRNHLRDIGIFMRRFGVEMPLKAKFWPKAVPKAKRKYSVSSVNQMLKVAKTEDEKDFVHFLLNTGFRDDEAAHAQYADIDFRKGSINVYAKPEYSWTPKNNKSREKDIVLGETFLRRMKARKERYTAKASDLIFPNNAGRPDDHLIRIVQRLIRRARLDEKASLHMFRKTFVTLVVNKRGLEQGRVWAGHDKVETTQAYIAADEMTTEQSRAVMEEIFSAIAN